MAFHTFTTKICAFLLFFFVSPAPSAATTSEFHGTIVDDPYVWLEEMDSPETKNWINEKNENTDRYFEGISVREKIKQKVIEKSNMESYGVPITNNGRIFFMMRGKDQDKCCLCTLEPNGDKKILVDPNTFPTEENSTLTGFTVSQNGKFLCYGLSESGSDLQEWKFQHLDSGQQISDEIGGIKFSEPEWSRDSRGVYYVRSWKDDAPSKITHHSIYHHRLGDQTQEEDRRIFDTADHPDWLITDLHVVLDGEFLLFSVFSLKNGDFKNNGFYLLNIAESTLSEVVPPGMGAFQFVEERGKRFFFITDHGASKNKLVSVDPFNSSPDFWHKVVSEVSSTLLEGCFTKDYIVCGYLEDCSSTLKVFDQEGHFLENITLPGRGTAVLPHKGLFMSGNAFDNEFYFGYTDFTTPTTIFQHDIKGGCSRTFFQPVTDHKSSSFVTKQVFFSSKDGTKIPMFITYKEGITLDGNQPTLMYGYGGFNLSMPPVFSPLTMTWLELGGIYVSVNLRGGGEYGKEWYEAGKRQNKQNVFDDFISAGEWLIANGYTNSKKLAINGRSNGGLLVGACLTQRPDLFAAAVPQVGVLDMLRFHKFTIGCAWMGDFGNPDDPEDFPFLYAYSPYHNVKAGENYPATLITTADHDDRVVPMHS
ncbi:MAG: Prolyl endopeptidase [Chlamydiae bacterium]|nr:Prolyl endopeptidase [Chlamydiota bacterium]